MPQQLTLFGREYCSLCQEMAAELTVLAKEGGFSWVWFDIEDDDEIEARYDVMVPVLVGEHEEVICFYHLDRRKLDAYLARLR